MFQALHSILLGSERKTLFSTPYCLSFDAYFCLCWGSEFGLDALFVFSLILCNPLEMTWSSATEMELQKRPLTSSRLLMRTPRNLIVWLRSMSALIFTYHSKNSYLFALSFRIPFFLPQSARLLPHPFFGWNKLNSCPSLRAVFAFSFFSFLFVVLFCFVLFSHFKYEIVRGTVNLVEKKNTIIVL